MANRNSSLENSKSVTITGGATGIGLAATQLFMRKGHKVYVLSRTPNEHLQPHTKMEGGEVHHISCDVRSEKQVKMSFEKIGKENGGIDIAINCAGILDRKSSIELSFKEFEDVIRTNLTGTWLCMKSQIPEMKKKRSGSIVNISSIFGLQGSPHNCAYTASKHGIIGLTKTFAVEYGPDNIRSNCVAPGFTDTPMLQQALSTSGVKKQRLQVSLPTEKFIDANEVAKTINWLACDAPRSVNGHCLVIDDGYTSGNKI